MTNKSTVEQQIAKATNDLVSVYSQDVIKTKEKYGRFLLLLDAKTEKICNEHLVKQRNTQLSYLPKAEREWHIATVKGILLDRFIVQLNKF